MVCRSCSTINLGRSCIQDILGYNYCYSLSRCLLSRGIAMFEEPSTWELGATQPHVPLFYEGELVGFFEPEYAEEVVDALNDRDRLQKALHLACLDLLKKVGAPPDRANELFNRYLMRAQRPKYGPRAIAAMLVDRQKALRVNPQEFMKFCNTYKISPLQLEDIYAGKSIDDSLIGPIARVLGIPEAEVLGVLNPKARK